MKCKHKRVKYTEWTPFSRSHWFENGKRIESLAGEPGNILPTIHIQCLDCPLDKDFNTYSKSCPRWVMALYNTLIAQIDSDS